MNVRYYVLVLLSISIMFISSCGMVAAKTASVTVCDIDHPLSEI